MILADPGPLPRRMKARAMPRRCPAGCARLWHCPAARRAGADASPRCRCRGAIDDQLATAAELLVDRREASARRPISPSSARCSPARAASTATPPVTVRARASMAACTSRRSCAGLTGFGSRQSCAARSATSRPISIRAACPATRHGTSPPRDGLAGQDARRDLRPDQGPRAQRRPVARRSRPSYRRATRWSAGPGRPVTAGSRRRGPRSRRGPWSRPGRIRRRLPGLASERKGNMPGCTCEGGI